jgi:hypothetical protein
MSIDLPFENYLKELFAAVERKSPVVVAELV